MKHKNTANVMTRMAMVGSMDTGRIENMDTHLDFANEASEALADKAEWLTEELKGALGADHALIALAEHVVTEAYRVAVLCALAKAESRG